MRYTKYLILTLGWLIFSNAAFAQKPSEITLSGGMAAGYNPIWGAYIGNDFSAQASFGSQLDLGGQLEILSPGIVSGGFSARPKIRLKRSFLYLDGSILYKSFPSGMYDYVSAGSLGWRFTHWDVQLGMYSRVIGDRNIDLHSEDEKICEPFNVLYRIQYNLKGDDSSWDAYAGLSNFTAFEYERHYSPIFYLGGSAGLTKHLGLYGELDIKPSGMFHLTAAAYGIVGRLGITYAL